MNVVYAAGLGFVLDLLLGDPSWMPHPIVFIGKLIGFLERILRKIFPKTAKGERAAGIVMVVLVLAVTGGLSCGILALCGWIHPGLRFTAEVIWSWQVLALKGLRQESMNVYRKLTTDTLENARKAVARIVGRDTQELSAEGVTKAAVETVAENFSDGVIAPLFWLLLGGAPLALVYKAVNTMDSMVGYKNERYLHFGRAAAKLDDAANYLPSRISALLLIAVCGLCGGDPVHAWKIWRRDRRKHASPNSAQTESAVAGALGVQLAGPAYYFGEYYDKPTQGDPLRPIEPEDIKRANRMNYLAGTLGLLLFCGLRTAVVLWMGGK